MQRQQKLEPNLCACVCEATGVDRELKPRRSALPSPRALPGGTSSARRAVAQLTQILDLTVTGGGPPQLCGRAIDGDKLLTCLIRQGVEASIKTIDATDPSYEA